MRIAVYSGSFNPVHNGHYHLALYLVENKVVDEVNQDEIFNRADIVSFHIPLTDETNYLINDEYLKKFANPVYLINTSRGKILNTKALVKAINSGRILGAAVDVFENENFNNLSNEETNDLQALISSNKVILTPHIAGLTHESERKIFSILLDKLDQ